MPRSLRRIDSGWRRTRARRRLRTTALCVAGAMLPQALALVTAAPTASAQDPYCGTASTSDGVITIGFSGTTVQCSYTVTANAGGEFAFTVPAGITTLNDITATGAPGTQLGGFGGTVTASTLATGPGQTLYFEVGGVYSGVGPGAYNGGGSPGFEGGGGGGATAVQTCPASACVLTGDPATDPRLLVASGGGGGFPEPLGGGGGNGNGTGGIAGQAGAQGGSGGGFGIGGGGGASSLPGGDGTTDAGGAGGIGNPDIGNGGAGGGPSAAVAGGGGGGSFTDPASDAGVGAGGGGATGGALGGVGSEGTPGLGGRGNAGGGGGGGFFGGGGGQGGGGAGSSYASPALVTGAVAIPDTTGSPTLTFSYSVPGATPTAPAAAAAAAASGRRSR
ncbi:hypothetical protein ABH920_003515 [Catenulispora sp. EB89]|uniref:hypothetical protein n=1 Tax=Catenulispora sp. EB89 TaxID=3156257 RepID=UPI0035127207